MARLGVLLGGRFAVPVIGCVKFAPFYFRTPLAPPNICMKTKNFSRSIILLACLWSLAFVRPASAQLQKAPPALVEQAPAMGTFYLLGRIPSVPYPFDPYHGQLPVYAYDGVFFVDDSAVSLFEMSLASGELFSGEEGGGMMLMSSPGPPGGIVGTNSSTNLFCSSLTNFTVGYLSTNGLALGIAPTTNPWMALTIRTTTTNASYDVFGTTNLVELALPALGRTNWTWLMRANGRATNFSWGLTNWCERYFQLGTMEDADNDGLTTAYEQLVSKTSPTNANSPRAIYEGVLSNQTPSAWFKLNDTNLADAQGGSFLTNGGGSWGVDAFAIGNSAFSFTNTSNTDRLTAGDVISGGTGTNQGSMSLLFRLFTSPPSGKRYLFSQKGASGSQEFAVFVESNGAPVDPAGLKVLIGGQTVTMSTALVFQAWHYLALTWHETNDVATWHVAPIGGTLTTGTINLTNSALVGSISNVYLGNRQNNSGTFTSAFRSPGNGALDQIAFWNRVLTNTEVSVQFDTLKALFQGPSKVFDLTRWELTLPVGEKNQLNNSHDPLDIGTAWLNSGFKYADPTNGTQKYFYLSNGNQMVFEVPWNGADQDSASPATSLGSPRSELRETLANGGEHNWAANSEGGTHTLQGTCKVISGTNKVIFGQIHAKTPIPTNGTGAVPAVILSHNPSNGVITLTVKNNPYDKNADERYDFSTPVPLGETINYTLQMVWDGTNATLNATVNSDVPKIIPMTQPPYDSRWGSTNVTLYFKAGCYYPKALTNGGTAKVTFSSLTVTPQP